jgi:hypothetical protein
VFIEPHTKLELHALVVSMHMPVSVHTQQRAETSAGRLAPRTQRAATKQAVGNMRPRMSMESVQRRQGVGLQGRLALVKYKRILQSEDADHGER